MSDPEHVDILPADIAPPPPTADERIDRAGEVLVAFIKAYAQQQGLTLDQVRAAIRAQM